MDGATSPAQKGDEYFRSIGLNKAPPSPPGGEGAHNAWKLMLGVAALIVLGALGYAALTGSFGFGSRSADAQTGILVLAVGAKIEDSSAARIFPAGYFFEIGELVYVPVDRLADSPEGDSLAYQHVFSGNSNFVAFVGATDLQGSSNLTDVPLQVYRVDISHVLSHDELVETIQNAEQITSTTERFRQDPSISNWGDVLFTSHEREDPESLFSSEANEWQVHLIPWGGEEVVLTAGIKPKWVSDTKFVFLKDDGLYLFDLTDGSEVKVWGMQGIATMTMNLDVSDDRQFLAWSAPEAGVVTILRTSDWERGALEFYGDIPVLGIAAVFSPDSSFLAVQSVDIGETQDNLDVAIGFFNTETLALAGEPLLFSGVDLNQTYLTDWRP